MNKCRKCFITKITKRAFQFLFLGVNFFPFVWCFYTPQTTPTKFWPLRPPLKVLQNPCFFTLVPFSSSSGPAKIFSRGNPASVMLAKIIFTSIFDIFNQNNKLSALQWFGTKIPLSVKSSKLAFYFSSESLSKQLWKCISWKVCKLRSSQIRSLTCCQTDKMTRGPNDRCKDYNIAR